MLGRLLLAVMVLLGSAELGSAPAAPARCCCCETTTVEEACGCGLPQRSNSRGGGQQAPTALGVAQSKPALPLPMATQASVQREPRPCPAQLVAIANGREAQTLPGQGFNPGEGPPRQPHDYQSRLGVFRI
ncbi:MAG: hypothetical protein IPN59_16800 [Holophaga sp.]|nr:hypothetical protein [Holophaga sp.]